MGCCLFDKTNSLLQHSVLSIMVQVQERIYKIEANKQFNCRRNGKGTLIVMLNQFAGFTNNHIGFCHKCVSINDQSIQP